MTLQALGIVILFIALLALAILVLLNNPRVNVNRRFALSALAIAGWIVSIYLSLSSQDSTVTVWLGRLGFAFASCIPFSLLSLFRAFSDLPQTKGPAALLPGAFCALFVGFSLTPWIVGGAQIAATRTNFVYGPLHRAFGLYFLAYFLFALYTLWKTIRSSSGLKRLQLRYLLLGILLGGVGAITTNLLVPLVTKTSTYSVLGPYFSLLVVSFSAHAIIRHRLMNIRLVVRRGIVYLIAAVVAGGVFVAVLATLTRLMGVHRQDIPLGTEVIVALAVALAFQPLKGWIQNSVDRYLYRESYSYQQIVRDASRTIGANLDLQSLLGYVCDVAQQTIRPDLVSVYVCEPGGSTFSRAVNRVFSETSDMDKQRIVPSNSPLPAFLGMIRRPLLRDELGRSWDGDDAHAAVTHLVQLRGDFVLPMFSEYQLIGFIVLGQKLSGDAYFVEDVELLTTITNQAAIAVKNAQLYRQVVLVNEYVENILRTMDSGVVTIDHGGNIVLSNFTAERLTGFSREILATMKVDQLPRALAGQLRATLADGEPRLQEEATLPGLGNRRTPLVCSSSALRDDRGGIIGALIVFSDLSSVKALEGEKRRAERLASLGALASGIAHEIKNPLVAIKTFAELLPERFSDSDFRHDFSGVVIREIERIDGLVGRLRGLAAPSQEGVLPVDIREPILETLSLLRAQFEQSGTTVHRYLPEAPSFVSVASDQLKQLFLNLFLNAIEAMGHGGDLTVRGRLVERASENWITLEVSDTGPGIQDALKSKIFDPFFTTKSRGSGLGLAICHSIADAHRGSIRAENNAHGPGTMIVVEFPVAAGSLELVQSRSREH